MAEVASDTGDDEELVGLVIDLRTRLEVAEQRIGELERVIARESGALPAGE